MPRYSVPRHHKLRRRPRAGGTIPVAGRPDAPLAVPVCWFSQPLQLRLDRPINHAEVTQVGGNTARADNATSITTYGGVFPFAATLTTAVDADATNLAHWTVTYNGTPRMRSPLLVLNLLYRTDAEKLQILGVARGERIRLTGLPNEWPTSARTLVIAGVTHTTSVAGRIVEWTTAPVIGTTTYESSWAQLLNNYATWQDVLNARATWLSLLNPVDSPGPWFRWGTSSWGGTDTRPF